MKRTCKNCAWRSYNMAIREFGNFYKCLNDESRHYRFPVRLEDKCKKFELEQPERIAS